VQCVLRRHTHVLRLYIEKNITYVYVWSHEHDHAVRLRSGCVGSRIRPVWQVSVSSPVICSSHKCSPVVHRYIKGFDGSSSHSSTPLTQHSHSAPQFLSPVRRRRAGVARTGALYAQSFTHVRDTLVSCIVHARAHCMLCSPTPHAPLCAHTILLVEEPRPSEHKASCASYSTVTTLDLGTLVADGGCQSPTESTTFSHTKSASLTPGMRTRAWSAPPRTFKVLENTRRSAFDDNDAASTRTIPRSASVALLRGGGSLSPRVFSRADTVMLTRMEEREPYKTNLRAYKEDTARRHRHIRMGLHGADSAWEVIPNVLPYEPRIKGMLSRELIRKLGGPMTDMAPCSRSRSRSKSPSSVDPGRLLRVASHRLDPAYTDVGTNMVLPVPAAELDSAVLDAVGTRAHCPLQLLFRKQETYNHAHSRMWWVEQHAYPLTPSGGGEVYPYEHRPAAAPWWKPLPRLVHQTLRAGRNASCAGAVLHLPSYMSLDEASGEVKLRSFSGELRECATHTDRLYAQLKEAITSHRKHIMQRSARSQQQRTCQLAARSAVSQCCVRCRLLAFQGFV
jgi:hypothetical protein